MAKYIYYGAGSYIRSNFEKYRNQYEPLCFCDRTATGEEELFGLPVLPPSAIFEKYPNASILVTLQEIIKGDVQNWLVEEFGVPAERIVDFEPTLFERKLTCIHLESYVQLLQYGCKPCCQATNRNEPPRLVYNEGSSPQEKVYAIQEFRKRLKNSLADGIVCECTDCPTARVNQISLKPKPLSAVAIGFSAACNLRCIYCNTNKDISVEYMKKIEPSDYVAVIEEMKRINMVDPMFTTVDLISAGELTLVPKLADFVPMLCEFKGGIVSNCTIYSDVIAEGLKIGNRYLNCSVDAGTRETYTKVKCVDYFEQVCDNLKRYATAGRVELKYILLPGINDSDADMNGFIQLIDDIVEVDGNITKVIISNNFKNKQPLGEHTLTLAAKMFKAAKARSIAAIVRANCFLDDDYDRLVSKIKEVE